MLRHFALLALSLFALAALPACDNAGRGGDDDTSSDDDGEVNPEDLDGDGFCPAMKCEDEDLAPNDCDDEDATANPSADEVCDATDNDCDEYIDENFDNDGDGFVDEDGAGCAATYPPDELDCNDNPTAGGATTFPGADELCDDADNDCDGVADNGLDEDNDTFKICDVPADCNDDDPLSYPNAPETCDEEDNNCDGFVDNGTTADFLDLDGDGFSPCADDCDDTNYEVHPAATEGCDEIDNDCDGDIDEDLDMDGDGIPGAHPDCLALFGAIDCDDNDATLYPGAPELCDLADNDCDGEIDENLDFDGDGFTSCEGDCNSLDAATNPNAPELCDGVDNDCDLIVDNGWDDDGDGQSDCAGDCDDTNAAIYLGAVEQCDGIDNDCDGNLGANETDQDGDGINECDGDCDETDDSIYPGAEELCNTIDDDCDGILPADEEDDDLDGYIGCTPLGCAIAVVTDQDDETFWAGFDALSPLGLDLEVFSDAANLGTAAVTSNFSNSQIILWYTGGRDITQNEHDAMEAWVQAGGGLMVTGPDTLSDVVATSTGDDDDSIGDDDDSIGDDDDSTGDDDDSTGDDDDSTGDDDDSGSVARDGDDDDDIVVDGTLLADLVRSATTGNGPQTTACAVSSNGATMLNGPYGTWSTANAFTASSTNHENAIADTSRGAERVASVGSRAKIIATTVLGGGTVIFWNGNEDLGDWDASFSADMAGMLRNAVHQMNANCGGSLQGGDCNDADATLVPGTCP